MDLLRCCAPVLQAPLDDTSAAEMAAAFKALADPARLRLLSLVAAAGEVCACDLVGPLGRSQPTVSHHLKVLTEVGLLHRERRGTWIWYRVVPERMAALRDALAPPPERPSAVPVEIARRGTVSDPATAR